MSTRIFAPQYKRTPEGYIDFGRDIELRKSLFIPEVFSHPAKMNLNLLQCIIDYVSQPGDIILDPMSGTGSLMIATLPLDYDRKVFLIEDAPIFHYEQTLSKANFLTIGVPDENIFLLQGPCQEYLPMTMYFNHVIFSPPYADVLSWGDDPNVSGTSDGFVAKNIQSMKDYRGASDKNLGRMPAFDFNQEMMKVYGMLIESLKPGGTMTVVIQDIMRGGKREELSNRAMRACIRAGFELAWWEKRYSSGTGMKSLWRSKGYQVVSDEDIICFRKP